MTMKTRMHVRIVLAALLALLPFTLIAHPAAAQTTNLPTSCDNHYESSFYYESSFSYNCGPVPTSPSPADFETS